VQSKGEKRIHDDVGKIERTWSELTLTFNNHKKTDIKVIAMSDDVLGALVDNMAKLQTMQASARYVEHYLDRVNKWQRDLSTTEQVLQDWLEVQSRWASLEAIYITTKEGSGDIREQLPEDSDRFDEIDLNWRELMEKAKNTPNVIEACTAPGRQQLLKDMKIGLQLCQRSLFQYLETKRKQFPRFYFLDDKALLFILAQGYNPQAVQEAFGGCFEGVRPSPPPLSLLFVFLLFCRAAAHSPRSAVYTQQIKRLEFEMDEKKQATKTAVGMHSKDGAEYVEFMKKFQCQGAVEDWLNALVRMMKDTLREVLMAAKFSADHWDAAENTRHEWALIYPAQVAVTASQIIWTEEVNSQFDQFQDGNDSAMRDYAKTLRERLSKLIEVRALFVVFHGALWAHVITRCAVMLDGDDEPEQARPHQNHHSHHDRRAQP
jgi:dynein heavy chain